MTIFRTHILIPVDPNTVQAGVFEVKRHLESELQARKLDQEIKVLETGTLGMVGQGVILVVFPERVCYTRVKVEDIPRIAEEHLVKGRVVRNIEHFTLDIKPGVREPYQLGLAREQKRIVLDKAWKIDPENLDEVLASGGYRGLEKILSTPLSPAAVIEEVKKSDLRGRGGAGFPTGMKWEFTRKARGETKYVLCNADEGEPGTFKDRLILEGDPHKLIEGMQIAGYAIGSQRGYIYIRGEYGLSIRRMQKAIDQARQFNLLGKNILETGFSFDLEIKKGAGAYVCGEETALIESLEGRRGSPRIKPPYPVTRGLWQRPTLVNNVETLANVPEILFHGSDWFRKFGTEKCPGTKVFTILGHVETPGLIEVEMGTPLREIVFSFGGGMRGGKRFKAALLGGAAGVFLSEDFLDVRMDFESLKESKAVLGSGAVLVMNEETSILDMLLSILKFFAHESCGQCTPCRVGTHQLLDLADHFRQGRGLEADLEQMVNISKTMVATSLCPLGQSLFLPVKSAVDNFRGDFLKNGNSAGMTKG